MADCVFCKIASGEIKGNVLYHDEHLTAFRDLNPQAPTHVLLIPNKHAASSRAKAANRRILFRICSTRKAAELVQWEEFRRCHSSQPGLG